MIKCLIVDDEPLAIDIIESYVHKYGTMEILGTFTNSKMALETLRTTQVDLVFLDIEMPNISGIDLVQMVAQMPLFIFTTAYPEYALEGFNLSAVDYLVKPVPFHRFVKAMSKVEKRIESNYNIEGVSNTLLTQRNNKLDFIFVKSEYENVKIDISSIKYIQGLKDYIKIYTDQVNRPILTLSSFKDILEKIPSDLFMRVHKSYIVNISKIRTHQKSKLLVDEKYIPIGNSYKTEVIKKLGV